MRIQSETALRRHAERLRVMREIDQAILGAKVQVPTLEGHAQLTIPPATSSGLKLRLRGKGARRRGGGADERGDLYAITKIVVPKEVPERAKELIKEFARLTAS